MKNCSLLLFWQPCSSFNAQATSWLRTPYIGLDYAYTDAGYAITQTKP